MAQDHSPNSHWVFKAVLFKDCSVPSQEFNWLFFVKTKNKPLAAGASLLLVHTTSLLVFPATGRVQHHAQTWAHPPTHASSPGYSPQPETRETNSPGNFSFQISPIPQRVFWKSPSIFIPIFFFFFIKYFQSESFSQVFQMNNFTLTAVWKPFFFFTSMPTSQIHYF